MTTTTKTRQVGQPDGRNGAGDGPAIAGYNSSIVDKPAYVKTDLAALIRQAGRLAQSSDLQAAEAACALAHHTDAAAKHRAILRSLRELAGREGGQHGPQ